MPILNRIFLIGRVGSDPKVVVTKNCSNMIIFSLATLRLAGKKKLTNWHSCVAFHTVANSAVDKIKKGNLIFIHGELNMIPRKEGKGCDASVNIIQFEIISGNDKEGARQEYQDFNPEPGDNNE